MQSKSEKHNRKNKRIKFAQITDQDINDANISKLNGETLLPFENVQKDYDINSQLIIKCETETKPEPKKEIPISQLLNKGIICLDKPIGPTSHQVSAYVQQILGIKKSGHSGTLDPKVSGILPIAIGRGTKVLQALLKSGKEYICICRLHKLIDEEKIKLALSRFVGKINQLPPIKSAVKRRYRNREIYYINVLEIDGQDVLFQVGCQAGTYMRKLCSDLGFILGTSGHMAALRRTKAGPFNEKTNKVTLQDLKDALEFYKQENNDKFLRKCIQPIEKAVEHLPKIWIQEGAVKTICHGATLKAPGILKYENTFDKDQLIAIMSPEDELVCIANSNINSNKIKDLNKGLIATSVKVLMEVND